MTTFLPAPVWRRALPFVLFMVMLAVRGHFSAAQAVSGHGGGLDARWLYGVGVLIVTASLVLLWPHYEELHVGCPRPLSLLVAVIVGVAVFELWVNLNADWMQVGTPAAGFRPVDDQDHLLWGLVLVRWLGASLMVPVMEELFWRSLLMRWVDRLDFEHVDPRAVSLRAIVLSTLAFTTVHVQWLAAIIAGLAYALLYRQTRNLWTSIVAHAVTNGILGAWVVIWGEWSYW